MDNLKYDGSIIKFLPKIGESDKKKPPKYEQISKLIKEIEKRPTPKKENNVLIKGKQQNFRLFSMEHSNQTFRKSNKSLINENQKQQDKWNLTNINIKNKENSNNSRIQKTDRNDTKTKNITSYSIFNNGDQQVQYKKQSRGLSVNMKQRPESQHEQKNSNVIQPTKQDITIKNIRNLNKFMTIKIRGSTSSKILVQQQSVNTSKAVDQQKQTNVDDFGQPLLTPYILVNDNPLPFKRNFQTISHKKTNSLQFIKNDQQPHVIVNNRDMTNLKNLLMQKKYFKCQKIQDPTYQQQIMQKFQYNLETSLHLQYLDNSIYIQKEFQKYDEIDTNTLEKIHFNKEIGLNQKTSIIAIHFENLLGQVRYQTNFWVPQKSLQTYEDLEEKYSLRKNLVKNINKMAQYYAIVLIFDFKEKSKEFLDLLSDYGALISGAFYMKQKECNFINYNKILEELQVEELNIFVVFTSINDAEVMMEKKKQQTQNELLKQEQEKQKLDVQIEINDQLQENENQDNQQETFQENKEQYQQDQSFHDQQVQKQESLQQLIYTQKQEMMQILLGTPKKTQTQENNLYQLNDVANYPQILKIDKNNELFSQNLKDMDQNDSDTSYSQIYAQKYSKQGGNNSILIGNNSTLGANTSIIDENEISEDFEFNLQYLDKFPKIDIQPERFRLVLFKGLNKNSDDIIVKTALQIFQKNNDFLTIVPLANMMQIFKNNYDLIEKNKIFRTMSSQVYKQKQNVKQIFQNQTYPDIVMLQNEKLRDQIFLEYKQMGFHKRVHNFCGGLGEIVIGNVKMQKIIDKYNANKKLKETLIEYSQIIQNKEYMIQSDPYVYEIMLEYLTKLQSNIFFCFD